MTRLSLSEAHVKAINKKGPSYVLLWFHNVSNKFQFGFTADVSSIADVTTAVTGALTTSTVTQYAGARQWVCVL